MPNILLVLLLRIRAYLDSLRSDVLTSLEELKDIQSIRDSIDWTELSFFFFFSSPKEVKIVILEASTCYSLANILQN